MYWKGLLSFLLGITLFGPSVLQAQNPADRNTATSITSSPQNDCSLHQDAVDREICAARQAISAAEEALAQDGISPRMSAHWEQIRKTQLAKINRLQALDTADRKKMQALAVQAELARKAASTR